MLKYKTENRKTNAKIINNNFKKNFGLISDKKIPLKSKLSKIENKQIKIINIYSFPIITLDPGNQVFL